MSNYAPETQQLIQQFQLNNKDTGSTSVQVILLTARISHLTDHLKSHKGDNHSRLGLLKMVSKRKSLMNYLKRQDINRFTELAKALNIRH